MRFAYTFGGGVVIFVDPPPVEQVPFAQYLLAVFCPGAGSDIA